MALEPYDIRSIPHGVAMQVVTTRHYLRRRAPCSVAFGLFLGENLKGVVCYGTPSSAPLRSGLAGSEHAHNVAELTRLWVCDSVPRNGESYLIGRTIARAGKEFVVSFAEPMQGHLGTVYQATNWLYTGLSAKRTNWVVEGHNVHCQTLADKFNADEIRQRYGDAFRLEDRPQKHRYVYINAKGARRKTLLAALRYPVLPYPKGKPESVSTRNVANHQLELW